MADGRQGGAAGAASHTNAVILSKTSGVRRPQLSNSCKYLKRNYVFYLQYIAMIVSYVAALLIISVCPCWDDAINLLPENINTKHIGSPFHGSGLYTAYHNVLNNGQVYLAPYSTEPLRRDKHKSNIYRKLLNYLFTTLLLSGDVQLNPGPNITEPAILTGVESRGWPRPQIIAAVEVGECYRPMVSLDSPSSRIDLDSSNIPKPLYATPDFASGTQAVLSSSPHPVQAGGIVNSATELPLIKTKQNGLNPAVRKHRKFNFFQCVNHSRVIWDPRAKPKGLLGGHLNIRSVIPKSDQIQHLLTDSNLDFLCLSETWLHKNSPYAALIVPGYNVFRRDRIEGRGGGLMIYIKEHIRCKQIEWSCDNELECIGLNVTLSPQMYFTLIGMYRLPSTKSVFFDQFNNMLRKFDFGKEVWWMNQN